MKKIFTLALCLFAPIAAFCQAPDPVSWQSAYKSISASEGEIIITAVINKGWHTYSQKPTTDGPIPTSFSFPESKQYQLTGKTEESDAHEEFVPAFGAKIFVFTDKAEFRQKVKITGKSGFNIPFKVEYMCCDDKKCLPPKIVDLSVKVQ